MGSVVGGAVGAITGIIVVVGLLALAWTVLIIWGSVWALTGRSRVLLIVAGSISIVVTGIGLVGNLSNLGDGFGSTSGGDVVVSLLFFAAAVAIVVLLCIRRRRSSSPRTAPAAAAEPGAVTDPQPATVRRRPWWRRWPRRVAGGVLPAARASTA